MQFTDLQLQMINQIFYSFNLVINIFIFSIILSIPQTVLQFRCTFCLNFFTLQFLLVVKANVLDL